MLLALLALALIALVLAAPLIVRATGRRRRARAAPQARPRGGARPAALRPRPRAPRRAARPRAAALLRQRRGVGDVPRPGLHPGRAASTRVATPTEARRRPAYAYLIYPHKPIVAYVPGERAAAQRVLRRVPRPDRRRRAPAPARLRRRARQVDGAHLRRGPRDPARQHAPRRPPARPRPRAPRPLAARRVGAPRRGTRRRRGSSSSSAVSGDLRSRSRVILDGPDRAQARAYLKGIGYDDDALQRPIVGIANTWTETMPCNFHLRRPRREGQGGRPRRGRHADGVQHRRDLRRHHDGHRGHAHLAGQPRGDRRLDRARRARAHVRRASIALSGCDKTIPGCVMALARLDVPSLMLYGGSIAPGQLARQGRDDPGRVRGHRRARGRRPDRRRAAPTSRTTPARAPAPAAASSPPTRWRWRSRCSASRRWAARWCPPRTARRARSPRTCGRLVLDVLERGPHARARSSPSESLENAIARRRDVGRLDQPGAAPARRRQRGGRRARHRRLRPDRLEHAAAVRPQARRPLRGHRPLPRRAASRS